MSEQSLVPEPVQDRARPTVDRLVAATAELLDASEEQDVTLAAIAQTSGVSSGSLAHHFGDRDGAIHAAHARRFARLMERQRALLLPVLESEDVDDALARCETLLDALRSGGEPRDRLTAVSVLAAARHRPALQARVAEELAASSALVAERVRAAQAAGIVDERLPATAAAVVLQMVVVLSRTAVETEPPLEDDEWTALLRVHAHAMHRHDCPTRCGPLPTGRSAPLAPIAPLPPPPPDEHRVLFDVVIDTLRRSGADSVVVRHVCAQAGVPLSTFHRRFGDRRHLIDAARLEVARRQAVREAGAIDALLEVLDDPTVPSGALPEALVGRLAAVVRDVGASGEPDAHLERIDLIASAAFRPELVADVALLGAVATTRLALVVDAAQRRGVLRADVSPMAAARLLWGLMSAGIVARVAGVSDAEWEAMVEVSLAVLLGSPTPSG